MARVLVTGGAGFIGSWIANSLCNTGHEVTAVDDLSGGDRSNLSLPIRFLRVDLRDRDLADVSISSCRPEVIYHLAANAREGASFFQPISVVSRNIGAYVNVASSAIKRNVKRIVLFSSIAVYGHQSPPFLETTGPQPCDIYGLSKLYMEHMTKMLHDSHGIEYVIVRPHNVFGPNQCLSDKFRNVIAIWMNQIMRGEEMTIYGDGSQIRAFSYIKDSLDCYVRLLDVTPNGVYNIGSDKPTRVIDAAKIVAKQMDVPDHPIKYLPDRHKEVKFAYTDHSLAKKVLGLKDTDLDSFVAGVKEMAEWARQQGPQEWSTTDELEIPNNKTPKMWL